MKDLIFKKINSATVFVDGNPGAIQDLQNFCQARAANYRFNPKYKAGYWDGYIYHFHTSTQYLPIGLVNEAIQFAHAGGYSTEQDFVQEHKISINFFKKFVKALNIRILDRFGKPIPNAKPRPYQLQSVYDALTKQHINIEVPTSGGKTLISYMIVRYLAARGMKMLLIVPTTTLVEQTYGDWFDFGWNEVRDNVHRIYSGQEKWFGAPITISTWQSLYKDQEIFEQFDCIMIDEAHGAGTDGQKAKSMNNIAKWCCNAEWRIGMSGTFPDIKKEEERGAYLSIVGVLGPIKTYTTYKEMEKEGWIPKIEILVILMKYKQDRRREIALEIQEAKAAEREAKECGLKSPGSPFAIEFDKIHNLPERNKFICQLLDKTCQGNSMVLFTKKEKHGLPLKEELEAYFKGRKKIMYVDGDIAVKDRNQMRQQIDTQEDVILLASYQTFSTGISIKNIHNIVFASSYKSKVKVLQSIGRGLRKMDGKTKVKIFDLVDDCAIKMKDVPGFTNYSLKHFKKRKEIYTEKGLNWKSIRYKF